MWNMKKDSSRSLTAFLPRVDGSGTILLSLHLLSRCLTGTIPPRTPTQPKRDCTNNHSQLSGSTYNETRKSFCLTH